MLVAAAIVVGGAVGVIMRSLPTPSPDVAAALARGDRLTVEALATDDTDTWAEADEAYAQVLATRPDDVGALRGMAVVDLGLHRFGSAEERAQAAVALQPNDHVAMAALADASIELGHYDQAAEVLGQLLSLRPGVEAYTRLSYLHQLRGADDEAVEAIFLALSAAAPGTPEAARTDAVVGELYYELGELDASIDHWRRATLTNPDRSDYRIGLARSLAAVGEADEARVIVAEALAADAGDTGALMLYVELATDDPSGFDNAGGAALPTVEEATDVLVSDAAGELAAGFGVDPSQPLFEATFADPSGAVALASTIHERRPDNIKADHALAWALHRDGRNDEALPHLEDALRFDTSDATLHRHAAEIYEALGESDRASDHRTRARALRPDAG